MTADKRPICHCTCDAHLNKYGGRYVHEYDDACEALEDDYTFFDPVEHRQYLDRAERYKQAFNYGRK